MSLEDDCYIFEPEVKKRLEEIITKLESNQDIVFEDIRVSVLAALKCISVIVDYFIERKIKPREEDLFPEGEVCDKNIVKNTNDVKMMFT